MPNPLSPLILSLDGQRAPAMALLEVLVAAAILAGATLLFLELLGDAHADLMRAERQNQAVALAQSLLQNAPSDWQEAPTTGVIAGMTWTRHCMLAPNLRSERLVVLECRVSVERDTAATLSLETAFVLPRARLLQP